MTLPDQVEITMPQKQQQKVKQGAGNSLKKVLLRAKDEGRLVCGVFECASHLEKSPELAMLCILPELSSSHITMSIQHKLIEAYCLENSIQLIKINSEKLNSLLNSAGGQQTENNQPLTTPSLDISCVIVEWPPKFKSNKHEQRLMDLIWTNQVVELPI